MGAGRGAVLIAGPTAGGKSAAALERARAGGGVVVNADAMQVYAGLAVLTAQPDAEARAAVPHRLYGTVDAGARFSVGQWLGEVRKLVRDEPGAELIFVGGTGLYFEALTKGIAGVPEVPAEVVAEMTALVRPLDREGRRALLMARDPAAARIGEPDPQRVVRALAVKAATGRSLFSFREAAADGPLAGFARIERLVVDPGREAVRERIAARFEAMLEAGAVEEVRALTARGLDPSLPAMKAIGVREIAGWLEGRWTREEAVARAVNATRQYAKRQRTWLRGRMAAWTRVEG